ncbi:hypothetical protein GW17_00015271, partial [Ensete ventricosum]
HEDIEEQEGGDELRNESTIEGPEPELPHIEQWRWWVLRHYPSFVRHLSYLAGEMGFGEKKKEKERP